MEAPGQLPIPKSGPADTPHKFLACPLQLFKVPQKGSVNPSEIETLLKISNTLFHYHIINSRLY